MQHLGQSYQMKTGFDSNMKLLMGGSFQGGNVWNKPASDIDKCFKIYFLHEGEAIVSSENDKTALCKNNLYFINGYALSSQFCPDFMSVEWLHFIPDSVYLNHLLKTSSLVIPLDIHIFSSFIQLFGKLQDYFNSAHPLNKERSLTIEIQSLLQFTAAQILKQISASDFDKSTNFIRLLPALEFINVHYNSDIKLRMLAEECCLSPNYFHRIFKQNFSITPFEYILKMRMEKALRLLIYTDKPIKEIAYKAGYEDEAYFSRMFSKIYQESPGRYRKRNQNRLP